MGGRGRGEVERIQGVNNSKDKLRWVVGGGGGCGCNNDFSDRSSTVSIMSNERKTSSCLTGTPACSLHKVK